jgi:hypothetical protein
MIVQRKEMGMAIPSIRDRRLGLTLIGRLALSFTLMAPHPVTNLLGGWGA